MSYREPTRPEAIRAAIREAAGLDRVWAASPAGHDNPDCTPWMPFPLFDFISMLAEAMPDAPGDRFLEAGCGIGTRMLIAREIFGLDVTGIERVPEYANQAAKLGLEVHTADVMEFADYGSYDVIWFNRPFRDRLRQVRLEAKMWDEMRSGSVVMCANLEGRPPQPWWLVLDDMEVRRGIWQKP